MDFNALGAKVLEEIKNGKPMFGKEGAFAPILEKILNAAFKGEMDANLTQLEKLVYFAYRNTSRNGPSQSGTGSRYPNRWQLNLETGSSYGICAQWGLAQSPRRAGFLGRRVSFKTISILDTVYMTLPKNMTIFKNLLLNISFEMF